MFTQSLLINRCFNTPSIRTILLSFIFIILSACGAGDSGSQTGTDKLAVTLADYQADSGALVIRGYSRDGKRVTISDADSGAVIGSSETDDDGNWRATIVPMNQSTCRIVAESDGHRYERYVRHAPRHCRDDDNDGDRDDDGRDDDDGDTPDPDPTPTPDPDPTPNPDPTPDPDPGTSTSHAGRYTNYEGSKTCMECHSTEVAEVHDSVHYQWSGPAPYAVNLSTGGKAHSINDFCGYPDINFIGQLTNLDGVTVDGGCATCHVGMGAKPDPVATTAQLENIDCLICHSDSYRRKVEAQADGSFRFAPAPEKMTVPLLEAITDIQGTPTRGTCVNCHSYAGGGCNNKRGDMEEEHRNPSTASFDVHMASTALGGAGLVCVDCHTTSGHKIAGRGSDLQPTDLDVPVRCTNCHAARPHGSNDIDKHTARIDCTVCHIPRFAKVATTDMLRDYSQPAVLDETKRLYDPYIERAGNVIPEYLFWNGTSTFYEFGQAATPGSSGRVVISAPVGDINDDGAKLFAFKHHLAVQPHDPVSGKLLPLKLGILFQTGDVNGSITAGAAAVGWPLPSGFDFIDTERYMGIFHEVSPANEALSCNDCHNGGSRVNFSALGYAPKPERNPDTASNCANGCHGDESGEWSASQFFTGVHSRHVDREGFNCSVCHNF